MKFTDQERSSLCFVRAILESEHGRAVSDMHRTSCAESIELVKRLIDEAYATARTSVRAKYLELHGEEPSETFVEKAALRLMASEAQP